MADDSNEDVVMLFVRCEGLRISSALEWRGRLGPALASTEARDEGEYLINWRVHVQLMKDRTTT